MYGRPRKLLVGAAAALGVLIVAGTATAVLSAGSGAHHRSTRPLGASPAAPTRSVPSGSLQAAAPATTAPVQSPVQQQYDRGFVQGYSSPSSKAMLADADALRIPSPAVAGGWPSLAVSNTPDGWARSFVQGLLTIDFARQSRAALGAWVVAQDAPDLMPGIPPAFAGRALYVSVMEPQIMSQPSMIPSPAQWQADAKAGVRWSVSDLQVTIDPQWQAMIDAGWQPRDLRASIEDVSGLLTIKSGTTTTKRQVSLSVAVGSAQWHQGYGTVAVTVPGG